MKLGLLYGGKSAEHKVSLQTALAVINALNKEKFEIHPLYITEDGTWVRGEQIRNNIEDIRVLILNNSDKSEIISPVSLGSTAESKLDVVFPLLHGPNGEDGTVQGLLEILNIPYVGNGVLASAAGMDKVIMKNLFAQAGLKQANYVSFIRSEWEKDTKAIYALIEKEVGYPCFVKPANLGSSVGISKCNDQESLENACKEAFQFDRKVIIEEGIIGREIEIGVMGNDQPSCSVAGEIVPKKEFYDYKAKYEDGDTAMVIPADISSKQYEEMQKLAKKSFQAIDGSGLVRADFFLTKDGDWLINEVNTMPGFTPFSMFPLLWEHAGVPYPELIENLVSLAVKRFEEKQRIKYTAE